MQPTAVFDTYWRFAARRQAVYEARLRGDPAPWTDDAILRGHRFTNCYRAADRVSQYLIQEVIYTGSQAPEEVVFRTLGDGKREANASRTWLRGGGRRDAALDGAYRRRRPLDAPSHDGEPPGLETCLRGRHVGLQCGHARTGLVGLIIMKFRRDRDSVRTPRRA